MQYLLLIYDNEGGKAPRETGKTPMLDEYREFTESIKKIYAHGMFVNAGFILGFDSEQGSVARGLIECIEATSIPVAMAGLLLNGLVLGAVVVEPIFAWPGLGWLLIQSVFARDYPVVVGGATIAAVVVTLVNLGVDVLQVWIDPRIRTT